MKIWKPIGGYEGVYEISNCGDVRRLKTIISGGFKDSRVWPERNIKPSIGSNGYYRVNLGKDGVQSVKYIHRLVGEAFLKRPDGCNVINHINGVKTDNRSSNLEFVTQSENMKHAYSVGLINNTGGNHGRAKITEKDVMEIKNLLSSGLTHKEIAKIFGLSRGAITSINNGKTWKHV